MTASCYLRKIENDYLRKVEEEEKKNVETLIL